jgi:hypothetical protein
MTKEEMFDWLDKNNAEIMRHPLQRWFRPDGTDFYTNFCLRSNNTQWPAFPTLQEAIEFAANFNDKTK